MSKRPVLYDYWRSSASYRVRIALNLLGIPYEPRPVNLLTKENRDSEYLETNPQGLLPTLEIDGRRLTQSLSIIEYLNTTSEEATLLPGDPIGQQRVRQLSYAIAMEIHPICNLSVAAHVSALTGDEATKRSWMQHFIAKGLSDFEALLAQGGSGAFCFGDSPTMADCCLIPQIYNADRWAVDYSRHSLISGIVVAASELDAIASAHPDVVGPPEG